MMSCMLEGNVTKALSWTSSLWVCATGNCNPVSCSERTFVASRDQQQQQPAPTRKQTLREGLLRTLGACRVGTAKAH